MGNLGWYQVIVTVAKRLGGPGRFILATMITGYAVFRTAEGVFKFVAKKDNKTIDDTIYEVKNKIEISEDFALNIGDKFKILEQHDNAVFVEVIGNNNNPYCVDKNILVNASNYK